MIEWLKHRWQHHKLQKRLSVLRGSFDKAISRAALDGDVKKVEALRAEHFIERVELVHEMERLESDRLLKAAWRYRLPVPNDDDDWHETTQSGGRHLTRAAQAQLRTAIRAEKKAPWDWLSPKMQLLSLLVAIIVASISLYNAVHTPHATSSGDTPPRAPDHRTGG